MFCLCKLCKSLRYRYLWLLINTNCSKHPNSLIAFMKCGLQRDTSSHIHLARPAICSCGKSSAYVSAHRPLHSCEKLRSAIGKAHSAVVHTFRMFVNSEHIKNRTIHIRVPVMVEWVVLSKAEIRLRRLSAR